MAPKIKKIKFALKMKDGIEVRTLQELKEAFDLNQIIGYYLDGKLVTWLKDRYYDDLAEQVIALDSSVPESTRKLCEIFDVEYKKNDISIKTIEKRNNRIEKLKEITNDEKIIENADYVAFSQEELLDLLNKGVKTIYLCGTDFCIPSNKEITYIGIKTKLEISRRQKEIYQSNGIKFINLIDEEDVFKEDERLNEAEKNRIHAIFLCKGDAGEGEQTNYLAYVTKYKQPYKENNTGIQYQTYLTKITGVNVREYVNAIYNGRKIIYSAKENKSSFLALMDPNGKNNKILKRWSETSNYLTKVASYIVGKKYMLVLFGDGHTYGKSNIYCERISMDGKAEEVYGLPIKGVIPYSPQRFWEMPQGFYSVSVDVVANEIVLYELLNNKTHIDTYKFSIKEYGSGVHGHKIRSSYGDSDTGRIYFLWEPGYTYDRNEENGYFYYLDINKKEIHKAIDDKFLLVESFVVKGNKAIFFYDKQCMDNRLMVLDMESGKLQCLWKEAKNRLFLSEKSISLIGEYLYIKSESSTKSNIYRVKIDGSERTIIRNFRNPLIDELRRILGFDKIVSQEGE